MNSASYYLLAVVPIVGSNITNTVYKAREGQSGVSEVFDQIAKRLYKEIL